jgi:hypothetical protein
MHLQLAGEYKKKKEVWIADPTPRRGLFSRDPHLFLFFFASKLTGACR